MKEAADAAVNANTPPTGLPAISGTAQVDETLTADTSGIDDEDGLTNVSYTYQWIVNDNGSQSEIAGATGSTYTPVAADVGKTIKVRVSFTDDAGNEESLTSAATAEVAARPNSPATGRPTISGTAQVDETLTADTSGITDADGLENATFTYQWIVNEVTDNSTGAAYTVVVADDGSTTWVAAKGTAETEIAGATGATYTLTDAVDGRPIRVRVTFTDDAGNEETLISAPILTASTHDVPQSHDGENVFTFELRFSEELKSGFSFKTLRDHAFTVTGGDITKAKRLGSSGNLRWTIHVQPDGNGNVTIVLPVTTDCDADHAICIDDGRALSNRLGLTVSGPAG